MADQAVTVQQLRWSYAEGCKLIGFCALNPLDSSVVTLTACGWSVDVPGAVAYCLGIA